MGGTNVMKVELDRDLGRAVAVELKKLGVQGPLIRAAEQGYITQLACAMPTCYCPEELGGRTHFEPVIADWSDWKSDWMPTHEHFPIPKRDGGRRTPDNTILAHRICNRLDFSISSGRPHAKDQERIRKTSEEAIRRAEGSA
jgi:hypothetical protein